MQNDSTWEKSDYDKTTLVSPEKYIVTPQKSVSTYESGETYGSKRSTEEEELRSLSTTPRYSHEDLGRIVSPPHSSDFSSGEADDNFDDSISAQQVLLKSRTTQFTYRQTRPVSDKGSVLSQDIYPELSEKDSVQLKLSNQLASEVSDKDSVHSRLTNQPARQVFDKNSVHSQLTQQLAPQDSVLSRITHQPSRQVSDKDSVHSKFTHQPARQVSDKDSVHTQVIYPEVSDKDSVLSRFTNQPTRQVFDEVSVHSQLTQQLAPQVSDKGSVHSQFTPQTRKASDKHSVPTQVIYLEVPDKDSAHSRLTYERAVEVSDKDSVHTQVINPEVSDKDFVQQQFVHQQPLTLSDKDSVQPYQKERTQSKQSWAKQVDQPYKKTFVYPEKGAAKTGQKLFKKDFSSSVKLPLKSDIPTTGTAPELPSVKTRKEYQQKSNHSDQDFKKTRISPGEHGNNRHLVSVKTDYKRLRAAELMQLSKIDANLGDIMMDADKVHRDLVNEHDQRKLLENQLQDIDEERKELNTKLATLRVKLGVANSNYNVSKNECDQMRKKYQETQIQKARLEERIEAANKELEKLKDPNNPDSNVNMKKVVLNDRKEIRRLRTELEGVRSERSEVQKQIQIKDEKIKMLHIYIGEAKDQLDECNRDYETAKISVMGERKKREEIEEKFNELMKDKNEFDEKMGEITEQLDVAISGTSGIQKQSEQYRDKEQTLTSKIDAVEKKLRDTLTAIEQQKNRNMPFRIATSIKHHQYRMSTSGWVTDTTPHVFVTTNANGSIASSGFLGKTVVSTKPAKSLPAGKAVSKTTPRSTGGSLPSKR